MNVTSSVFSTDYQQQQHQQQQQHEPTITLLLENLKKQNNLGPLLRCCAAFGISQIFVVGYETCSVQGSHGSSKHVELVSFPTYQQAIDQLVTQDNFQLIGLLKDAPNAFGDNNNNNNNNKKGDDDGDDNGYAVIREETVVSSPGKEDKTETIVRVLVEDNGVMSDVLQGRRSYPVHMRKFSPRTCLVLDKRSYGLSASLAEHCHSFVHIPHYDDHNNESHKRGWLTMESCLSIVLHQFTAWAGYDNKNKNNNNNYQGQKYHVQRVQKGAKDDLDEIQKRNEERRKKIQRKQEELEEMEKEDGGLTGYLPGFIGGNDDKNNGDY